MMYSFDKVSWGFTRSITLRQIYDSTQKTDNNKKRRKKFSLLLLKLCSLFELECFAENKKYKLKREKRKILRELQKTREHE